MPIVVLQLPNVKRKNENRPKACPYCQGETFQRWGKVTKPVKDNRHRTVSVYRYRCNHCGRTFRHYPEGVDRADQTRRMRKLAAICWVLGLSLRGVSVVLTAFHVEVSHMSVWRDMQEQAALLEKRRRWQGVRVWGVDGAYPLGWGKKQPVLIAVDLGDGQPVAIGHLDEANPQALRRFLQPLVQRLGVSVIVTDDLASFRSVADKLGLEHQVCQFHVRRWVGRTLHELKDRVPLERLILDAYAAGRPLGFICIAPVIAARVLGAHAPRLTIGRDPDTAAAIESFGARHVACEVDQIVVDAEAVPTVLVQLGEDGFDHGRSLGFGVRPGHHNDRLLLAATGEINPPLLRALGL